MNFSGERAMDKIAFWNLRFADHLERYHFAKKYCDGAVVLDVACGSGYGTQMLSNVAKKVVGLDVDATSVDYCKSHIHKDNCEFLLWDWVRIPFDDNTFDVVVSFETIEHIVDYHGFMKEVKRVLKPGGTLILSTPNYMWEVYKNIYHVSNFTTIHLVDLFHQYYKDFKVYYQGKHIFPFPGRWFIQVFLNLFWIRRDIKIRDSKPKFDHHVTMIVANKS